MFDKWDRRMLQLSMHISDWSRDPSTKVGAVIADGKHRVLGLGYNGFPRGVEDDERLNIKEEKYPRIIHGEINAILNANRSVEGGTLYTYPFPPCTPCAAIVIQSGIKRVVAPVCEIDRWLEDITRAEALFAEAGVRYVTVKKEQFA